MKPERLIGRDAELEVLGDFLRLPEKSVRGLVLRGEPGIGKTTLWLAGIEAAAASGYRVLSCSPVEAEAGFSFSGLIDLLGTAVGEIAENLPATHRRALESALLLGEQERVDARLVSVAVLGAVRGLAARRPLLLAVDDLDCLDLPSARVLAYALRRLDTEPVAVLATVQAGSSIFAGVGQALAQREAHHLDLGPLPFAPLRQLVRSRAGARLSQAELSRIARVSRGNPLHALELAGGAPAPAEELRLTPAVRDAVLAIFALSQPIPSLVGRGLAGAVKAGIAERDGDGVRLGRPVLGAILYGGLADDERCGLHTRLAALPLSADERARHLALSTEEPSAALADELDAAAAAARRRGAIDMAAELSGLALRVTPPADGRATTRRLLTLALDEYRAGDAAQARERWEEVVRKEPSGPVRARAAWHLLEFYGAPSMRGYDTLIRTGLRGAADDAELRGRVHTSGAAIWLWGGKLRRARRHLRQALPLTEACGDGVLHAYALAIAAQERFLAGAGGGVEAFDGALAVADDAGSVPLDLDPRLQRAFMLLTAGDDLAATRAELARLLAVAQENGEDAALAVLYAFRAETEALAGDPGQVERHLADAERWAEFAGAGNRRGQLLYLQAFARTLRGDFEVARDLAVEALAFDEGRAVLLRVAPNQALLASILHRLGEDEEAARLFERARSALEGGGYHEPSLYRFTPANVGALIALDELEQGAELVTRWAEAARRLNRASVLAAVPECEGMLLGARGDVATAHDAYARARRAYERLGYRFDAARMVLACGHAARRHRRKSAAGAAFAEAEGLFAALGAVGWAERAHEELRRVAVVRRDPTTLTVSERRVAALVASGRRNREIADALVVSPKTVEAHLTRIYAKLGISSRSQLVARVAERPELLLPG